jgi:hypothetical protein
MAGYICSIINNKIKPGKYNRDSCFLAPMLIVGILGAGPSWARGLAGKVMKKEKTEVSLEG